MRSKSADFAKPVETGRVRSTQARRVGVIRVTENRHIRGSLVGDVERRRCARCRRFTSSVRPLIRRLLEAMLRPGSPELAPMNRSTPQPPRIVAMSEPPTLPRPGLLMRVLVLAAVSRSSTAHENRAGLARLRPRGARLLPVTRARRRLGGHSLVRVKPVAAERQRLRRLPPGRLSSLRIAARRRLSDAS